MASLLQLLQKRDAERLAVQADFEALRRRTPAVVERAVVRARFEKDLAEWQTLLTDAVTGAIAAGREVLRSLLHGPLMCWPGSDGGEPVLQLSGAIQLDRVLRGCSGLLASPISASWNQLKDWMRAVDGLRRAA